MELLDIGLIIALVAILLFLMWKWRNGLGNEMELPDEDMAEKIGEFRVAVITDMASYIASRYKDIVEAEDVDITGYQTSYDNSIVKLHLPNDCIHTIEINWKTNEYIVTSQYIPEGDEEIKQYSSRNVLREGYLADFVPLQEHCNKFNEIADLKPIQLQDLDISELYTSVHAAIETPEIQNLSTEDKLNLLLDGVGILTEMLDNEEIKKNPDFMDGYIKLLTYVLLEYKEEFKEYLSQTYEITEEDE